MTRKVYCIKGICIHHPIRFGATLSLCIVSLFVWRTIWVQRNPANLKITLKRTPVARLNQEWVDWLEVRAVPIPPEQARLSVYRERAFSPDTHTFCLLELPPEEFHEYLQSLKTV